MTLRVVVDTNIFVSSLLVKQGLAAQVLAAWRRGDYSLVTSPPIIAEIRHTLSYPRIRRRYGITDQDVEALLLPLLNDAELVVEQPDLSSTAVRDPADIHVLSCAVAAQADLIVSGDQDLLALESYLDIPVLTVRAFLAHLSDE